MSAAGPAAASMTGASAVRGGLERGRCRTSRAASFLAGIFCLAPLAGTGRAATVEPVARTAHALCSSADACLVAWQEATRGTVRIRARFRQERRTALLLEPLVSTGQLDIRPPERFALRVEEPEPWSLLLEAGGARGGPPGHEERLDPALASAPALRTFADLLRGRPSKADFKISLVPDAPATLRLQPRGDELADAIAQIRVELDPNRAVPARIVIVEPGGDRTELRLLDVVLERASGDGEPAP